MNSMSRDPLIYMLYSVKINPDDHLCLSVLYVKTTREANLSEICSGTSWKITQAQKS